MTPIQEILLPWPWMRDFFELGGEVLWLIALVLFIMWLMIFERLLYLHGGHRRAVALALDHWRARNEHHSWSARRIREYLISVVRQGLERNLALIKTCVALCPLLGLLGTVTGMIQVFEVMALSGSGNVRSLAEGVSKATIPTMAGMVAALSGLMMSLFLERQARRRGDLLADQLIVDSP